MDSMRLFRSDIMLNDDPDLNLSLVAGSVPDDCLLLDTPCLSEWFYIALTVCEFKSHFL